MRKIKKDNKLRRCVKCVFYEHVYTLGIYDNGYCPKLQIQRYADDIACSEIRENNKVEQK